MSRKNSVKDILRSILRPPYHLMKDLSPYSKRLVARNSVLGDKYDGQRGFLLLSGEPLSCIDISKLRGEYTAGCGFLFLDKTIVNLPLSFVFAVGLGPKIDRLNRPGASNWPEELIRSYGVNQGHIFLKNVKEHFTDNGTITFLNADRIAYYKRIKLFNCNEPNVFYIKVNPYLFNSTSPKLDLTKRFPGGNGCVFYSILTMMYMGFKEIYLCGAGYTYKPVYVLHFYDNFVFPKRMGREEAEIEARKAIDIRNKKIPSNYEYRGLSEKGDLYRGIYTRRTGYDSYWDKHRILNDYARTQGVRIYNIVPDGFESPIYEKKTWKEIEDKVLPNNPDNILSCRLS